MNISGVMQITDTLRPGGLEHVAVNLANSLPPERFTAHLCATRQGGPLESLIAPQVKRLNLNRRSRFDRTAITRLRAYLR